MARSDLVELEGVVLECLPGTKFTVQVTHEGTTFNVNAYLSGKLRQNYIRVLTGDHVTVAVSPYNLYQGKIIWRKK